MRAFFEFFNRLPFIHFLSKPIVRLSLMAVLVAIIGFSLFINRSSPNKVYVKIAMFKPFTSISSDLTYESIKNTYDYKAKEKEIEKILEFCSTVSYDYSSFESQATYLNCLHFTGAAQGDNYWALSSVNLFQIPDFKLNNNFEILKSIPSTAKNFSLKSLQNPEFQQEVKPGLFTSNTSIFNFCVGQIKKLSAQKDSGDDNYINAKKIVLSESCQLYSMLVR